MQPFISENRLQLSPEKVKNLQEWLLLPEGLILRELLIAHGTAAVMDSVNMEYPKSSWGRDRAEEFSKFLKWLDGATTGDLEDGEKFDYFTIELKTREPHPNEKEKTDD